jgi:hypothetical protein
MVRTKNLILFILLLISCKDQVSTLLKFDPRSIVAKEISLSDIADEITYIPLANSFQIGLIYNFRVIKNSIYLSAKDIGILEFDREGKKVRKIGSIGRGPGEYTYCFDFTVDDNRQTIYVMDQANLKVYSKTGNFLRIVSLKDYGDNISSFELIDSKIIIYFMLQYGNPKYDWIVLDTLGNLITEKKRTIPEFKTNWLLQGGTYKFDNRVTYWNPFTDTAYSVSPDLTYKASFIISPGEHRFPKIKFDSFEQFRQYLNIEQIFETNNFLILRYYYKKPTIALIDKKTRKSFLSFLKVENGNNIRPDYIGGLINDIDGGCMFQPCGASARQESYFFENDREYIIGLIEPYKIKTYVAGNEFKNSFPKYPERKKEFGKFANSLKETDNPVLMMVRLKK